MKRIVSICLLFNFIFLTGCWDMREINEIGFVMEVGVDKAEDTDNFIVTVQIANPKPIVASQEKTTAAEPFWVYTAKGKTIFEAVRQLSQVASKRIVWAHNYIVIIGQSLAEYDIAPVIDFFTHNPELRMKTAVVVSKGNAKEYVGSKAGMEDISGVSLNDIANNVKLTGEYVEGDMLELSQDYFSPFKQPILSMISFKKEKIKPADGKADEEIETVEMSGAAIFNKNKMIGTLSAEETRGIAWVFNDAKNALVSVVESEQDNTYVSVETKNVKSKITTKIKDEEPSIEIKITGTGEIVEEDGTTDLPIDEFKTTIATKVNNQIIEDVKKCINKVQQEYKVDSLNFADNFHAQHKKDWHSSLGEKWESIYPTVPITISADITIISSVLNQIPAKEPKKEGELNSK